MDDQSLQAIIEIMTLETADALAVGNGNHTDASFTDRDVALQLEQENWNTLRATLNDRRIARRIAGGVQQDWDALDVLPQEEDGASHDRGIAVTTADSANEATDAPQQPNPMTDETLDGADFTQKDSQIASNMDGNGNSTAEVPQQPNITTDELPEEAANPALAEGSSNTQSTESGCSPLEDMKEFGGNENVPEEPRLECLACMESRAASGMLETPFVHHYCQPCIAGLFRGSLRDETLFPPSCCVPIPLGLVEEFLDVELVEQYRIKLQEHSDRNRVYCSNTPCSKYLRWETKGMDVATCPDCQQDTCLHCKSKAHTGPCGDERRMDEALTVTANAEGWQRCPGCSTVDAARSSVMSVVRGGKPASAPNTPKTGPHTEHPSATINGAGIGLMGRIGARSVIIS